MPQLMPLPWIFSFLMVMLFMIMLMILYGNYVLKTEYQAKNEKIIILEWFW